jgi:hypothetical protein
VKRAAARFSTPPAAAFSISAGQHLSFLLMAGCLLVARKGSNGGTQTAAAQRLGSS